ncbi:putative helicase MAGATAMA 3 [Platanthera guangdongensis]|uniref:Helicase MAGATAMA 3 n=1 Tax=Platanthera guangdongensis TaxID=2320717 RepID=A0ABR2MVG5_9ASPA
MAKRACSRRELLDRWMGIQEEEDEDDPSPTNQLKIRRAKENWFSDCFWFLINLPNESHIWCGYSDLMGPLLETFHNYFNDKSSDSPLKLIWKRISSELRQCMQCIFHHHHAQESYTLEYESDVVGPLLKVLCMLDEERVAEHIEKINARMKSGEYDADSYCIEVVCIMFEVLTYPVLLEDQCLVNEFQNFLGAVDNYHDVTLAGGQQYLGVYALLFLKSGRARAIGVRLAACMGKLRGPALVNSLKNLSLHSSLRQPAFDLITTIIISDSSALIALKQKIYAVSKSKLSTNANFINEDDEPTFSEDVEEKDNNCWMEFSTQSMLASSECTCWKCVPMLWITALFELDPATLPIKFSKALFWALSRVSVLELNFNVDMLLSVKDWFTIHASEISSSFGWQIPTGFDDGGEGKESRNSVRASSSMCIPLLRAFKRLAAEFISQLEKLELQKQWTWEPRMAESIILSLADPDDVVRKAGKIILEHMSSNRLLTSGLQFLCSSASSLSSVLLGLRFMFKQIYGSPLMDSFHNLHHVFFVTGKLLKEFVRSSTKAPSCPKKYPSRGSLSSQGGFLLQPFIDHLPASPHECQPNLVGIKSWEKFSCLLSVVMWSPVLKCLVEGKELINNTKCQMTCVRLLETLPAIYGNLCLSKSSEHMVHGDYNLSDFTWLSDLVDWGRSHLVVVVRHWKQCMLSLLNIFKDSYGDSRSSMTSTIEKIISYDTVTVDSLQEQMLHLMVSLSHISPTSKVGQVPKSKSLPFELHSQKNVSGPVSSFDSSLIYDYKMNNKPKEKEFIILSDDEPEKMPYMEEVASRCTNSGSHRLTNSSLPVTGKRFLSVGYTESMISNSKCDVLDPFPSGIFVEDNLCSSSEEDNVVINKPSSISDSVANTIDGSSVQGIVNIKGANNAVRSSSLVNSSHSAPNIRPPNCQSLAEVLPAHPEKEVALIKHFVQDDIDDPLELALDHTSHKKSVVSKPSILAPKRKVIQLQMPANNIALNKPDISSRRLRPPRLDVWFKSILELDYFVVAGLYSAYGDEKTTSNLNKVPLHFQSLDHYIKIFQPLVLEEFKAQLHNSFLESSVENKHCGSLFVVSVERIDDFHIIRGCPDEEFTTSPGCMENDLILLTKEPLENSVQTTHVLGKVERREKSDKKFSTILVIKLYLPDSSSRLNKVKRLLIERSKWFLNKVMNITSQLREFQALSSLNVVPMLPIILNPVDHSLGHTEPQKVDLSKLSQSMQEMFKSSFNSSQLWAISVAIRAQTSRKFELSLIQGPPGTGKTRTIVAIISALLSLQRVSKNYSCAVLSDRNREINTLPNSRTHITHSAEVARAWQGAAFAKQLLKDTEKGSSIPRDSFLKGRVLICAQSNAAVDELVSRISEGLCGNDGKLYKPFIVRVGNAKTVHPNSLPFFIDTLVELRLTEDRTAVRNADGGNDSSIETSNTLRSKLEKLVESIQHYESKRVKAKDGVADSKAVTGDDMSNKVDIYEMSDTEMGAKLSNLYREKRKIYQDLAYAQAKEKKTSEESRALKHKIRKSILREAEIVVTTLSGCGGDLYGVCYESTSSSNSGRFTDQCFFDVVVVDEAAQALEPATLIPLQLLKSSGAKCVMVGDPKQLPATVLSSVASKFLYECSMFERLQRAGYPVILLTEQYRMHPEICSFPSSHFYDNKLLNGVDAASKSAQFHGHTCLGPYMFFDIPDGREQHGKSFGSMSLYNEAEAEAAISILKFLRNRYSSDFTTRKIGIITPYKSQLHLLRSQFSKVFGSSAVYDMEFNTIDGFQGREVDILILTTVRSSIPDAKSAWSSSVGIGFVADIRRMNVALTRAKISLWIVGNASTLQKNPHWGALVQNAKERSLFMSVSRPYDSFFEKGPSFTGGNSCSSRSVKKNDPAKSEVEPDKIRGRDAYRKKTKSVGGKEPVNSKMTSNSEGNSRLAKDKNRISAAHEEEYINLLKNKDSSTSSGKSLQKTSRGSKGVNKSILEKVQLQADSHPKTATKDKLINKIPTTSEEVRREGSNEKSMPSDVKTAAKDLLASRKRQRDDIEALLPSALISSKKSIKKPPPP